MATLHSPTAWWPSSSSAWVTIPTGLVKSTSQAPRLARAAISSASSSTIGTVRSALANPPAPVVSWPEAAVPDRQRLVDVARRLAADAQLDHDEVGPLRARRAGRPSSRTSRSIPVPAECARRARRPPRAAGRSDRAGRGRRRPSGPPVAQAVDQLGGVGAPAADDGHLGPHAAQRNIRPCPNPPISSRPCWRSTGAAPRPMSSSSRGWAPCSAGPGSARATINSSASTGRSTRWPRRSPRSPPTRQRSDAPLAALPDRRLLPGRHRPARRRGEAGAGDRRDGVDRSGHPAQRHLRRLTRRDDGALGHRRRLRHGHELRRRRARRADGALPRPGRAVGRLRARRRLARACARSASRCGPATGGAPPTIAARAGARAPRHARRRGRADRHLHRRHPLHPALRAGPRPPRRGRRRRRRPPARRPTSWPTRSPPSSGPPSSGSTCRTKRSRWSSAAASSTRPTPPSTPASRPASSAAAPRAVLVRLDAPPVLGAALIGLDAEDAPSASADALRQALRLTPDSDPDPDRDSAAGAA